VIEPDAACDDLGGGFAFLDATASVTVLGADQGALIAATATLTSTGTSDTLNIDVCYLDPISGLLVDQGLNLPIQVTAAGTVPITLYRTFPGLAVSGTAYQFGLCGCVPSATGAWTVTGSVVNAQLFQQ
jgi:hypothetical protein